jgi:hypothetical protein
MKILIAALLSFTMIAATIPSAKADNSEEVIIGVLGGALGGLIIGEAIGGHRHRERVVERQYIYVDPEPYCYEKRVRVWDPYRDRYVRKIKVICE